MKKIAAYSNHFVRLLGLALAVAVLMGGYSPLTAQTGGVEYRSDVGAYVQTPSEWAIIYRPAGLAVGDLMVAFIEVTAHGPRTIREPSGWIALHETSDHHDTRGLYWKIATSADVNSAFSFFRWTGNSIHSIGLVARMQGHDPMAPIAGWQFLNEANADHELHWNAVTSFRAQSLSLLFATWGRSLRQAPPAGYVEREDHHITYQVVRQLAAGLNTAPVGAGNHGPFTGQLAADAPYRFTYHVVIQPPI